jgi:hypothetical protein
MNLPVTFGDPTNYRTETLTFEVVRLHGSYHAILGRPCYEKFMAIPKYMYLKLKMLGPYEVITIGSFQHAYQCHMESCELALVVIASEELAVIWEETMDEAPNYKRNSGSFEPTVDVKGILIDPDNSGNKRVQISTALFPK